MSIDTPLVAMHILAGGVALAAGFLALYSQKGHTVHRRAGRTFSYAMLLMTSSALLLAIVFRPNRSNMVAASVTLYLVATGLVTVIRRLEDAPRLYDALFGFGFFAAVAAWGFGIYALGLPGGILDHVPAPALFMFATVATLGVIGDARLLRAGSIEGVPRLRRHLWRMNFAMWVATSSFFFGQARQLPQWFRDANLNVYLVLLVALTLVYWLVRLRPAKKGSEQIISRQSAPATASASGNNLF